MFASTGQTVPLSGTPETLVQTRRMLGGIEKPRWSSIIAAVAHLDPANDAIVRPTRAFRAGRLNLPDRPGRNHGARRGDIRCAGPFTASALGSLHYNAA